MQLHVNLAGEPLYRSSTNAWIFGICGAVANRFGVHPNVVRALFVLLSWTIVMPVIYLTAGFSIHSDILS